MAEDIHDHLQVPYRSYSVSKARLRLQEGRRVVRNESEKHSDDHYRYANWRKNVFQERVLL